MFLVFELDTFNRSSNDSMFFLIPTTSLDTFCFSETTFCFQQHNNNKIFEMLLTFNHCTIYYTIHIFKWIFYNIILYFIVCNMIIYHLTLSIIIPIATTININTTMHNAITNYKCLNITETCQFYNRINTSTYWYCMRISIKIACSCIKISITYSHCSKYNQ